MSETFPRYSSGEDVRCGDRVSYNGQQGRIVFVTARGEYATDFPATDWSHHRGLMIRFDNGARLLLDQPDDLLSLGARP